MKEPTKSRNWIVAGCIAALLPLGAAYAHGDGPSPGRKQMELLDRGVVAVKTDAGVFVSWRLLGNESYDAAFDISRAGR
jgi:rhamnogalacturonan endolyase